MATKAELEAELEKLRARNAQLEKQAEESSDKGAESGSSPSARTEDEIRRLLEDHGIDLSKAKAVW